MGKNERKKAKAAEYDKLRGDLDKAKKWAKYYQETEGLTYEQAILKAWNNDKSNKCKHKGF